MELPCKHCNKKYASQSSRSNHVKKYHSVSVDILLSNNESLLLKNNICSYCNKELSDRTSRWRHEKKCKEKQMKDMVVIKEQNKKIVEEMKELKTIVTKLSKTTGPTSITNINNGTIIVNHINSLGYENIQKNLTEKEKILLLTSMRVKEHPIIELVRMIYTEDKFKGERNTVITNLRSKECLTYNSEANKFDATAKKDHIDNIIENRRTNIVAIYKELSQNNKLRPVEIKIIDAYLEEIEDLGKKNPKVKALYEKHKAEIIYIIYNCKEFMNRLRENMPNVVEQEDSTDEENNIEV